MDMIILRVMLSIFVFEVLISSFDFECVCVSGSGHKTFRMTIVYSYSWPLNCSKHKVGKILGVEVEESFTQT